MATTTIISPLISNGPISGAAAGPPVGESNHPAAPTGRDCPANSELSGVESAEKDVTLNFAPCIGAASTSSSVVQPSMTPGMIDGVGRACQQL